MGQSAEVRRERRRAQAAPFSRPRGGRPLGCTWDAQQGGWWRSDGSEWKKADEQKLKAERKQQLRDDEFDKKIEERAAPGEAWLERRDAVCTDTVYCAKHLYPLINGEKCSACADLGWRDTRHAPHPSMNPLTHVHISTRVAWQVRLLRRPFLRTHAL